jgi:hypothetical protein
MTPVVNCAAGVLRLGDDVLGRIEAGVGWRGTTPGWWVEAGGRPREMLAVTSDFGPVAWRDGEGRWHALALPATARAEALLPSPGMEQCPEAVWVAFAAVDDLALWNAQRLAGLARAEWIDTAGLPGRSSRIFRRHRAQFGRCVEEQSFTVVDPIRPGDGSCIGTVAARLGIEAGFLVDDREQWQTTLWTTPEMYAGGEIPVTLPERWLGTWPRPPWARAAAPRRCGVEVGVERCAWPTWYTLYRARNPESTSPAHFRHERATPPRSPAAR